MNKESWEIKRLGDICNLYQPKTISASDMKTDGKYPVFGANGIIGKYDKYNHENPELLMTCRGATCGTLNISEAYSWINGNAMVIHPKDRSSIIFEYLYYQLSGADLSTVITGAAQPQITRQSLTGLKIVIPPIRIQERAIEELDALGNIIVKKKEQILGLDTLAQATFYEMFGDPLSNEKKLPLKKLGKIAKLKGGYAFKSSDYRKEGVKLVQIGNVNKDNLDWDVINYLPNNYINGYREYVLSENDIVLALTRPIIKSLNAVKIAVVKKTDLPCLLNQRVGKFEFDKSKLIGKYLEYFCKQDYFKEKIERYSSTSLQPNVSSRQVEAIDIILPPLPLQNQFSEQIEAIDKQKNLINQSIKEVQLLFDYTMDKYFN